MNINYDIHPSGGPYKVSKKKITRKFKDSEGNLWGLQGASVKIVVWLILKELKHDYVGEIYGIDHAEWKRLINENLWKEVTV